MNVYTQSFTLNPTEANLAIDPTAGAITVTVPPPVDQRGMGLEGATIFITVVNSTNDVYFTSQNGQAIFQEALSSRYARNPPDPLTGRVNYVLSERQRPLPLQVGLSLGAPYDAGTYALFCSSGAWYLEQRQ